MKESRAGPSSSGSQVTLTALGRCDVCIDCITLCLSSLGSWIKTRPNPESRTVFLQLLYLHAFATKLSAPHRHDSSHISYPPVKLANLMTPAPSSNALLVQLDVVGREET